jgi:anaerobic ribonucleoside-triphosphate reductase activating protein
MKPDHISGLTVLGGEPMEPENVLSVYCLLEQVREYYKGAKNIWLYSGFTFEELISRDEEYTNGILSLADVMVDGPYIEAERDITLKFRGSRNQRIIDLNKTFVKGSVVLYEV